VIESRKQKVNWSYLLSLMTACGLGSSTFGFALGASNQTTDAMAVQFGWCPKKTFKKCDEKDSKITILSTAVILGIALGSMAGG
jgi:hypothetical protein